jgi:hypothetical protein
MLKHSKAARKMENYDFDFLELIEVSFILFITFDI